ncbi:unnamed protein product, partial [Adineta ricciae]
KQTTMVIITSDENIIRQFASIRDNNTYMVPLNDPTDEQNITMKANTRNDQVPKRAIDTTDSHPTKSVKTKRKSLDLLCAICGDRAIGYNYAVLSCASCKAFFHRNGQYDLKRFKCLSNHGRCVIDVKEGRKCHRCRLERCLAMGMRQDLLITQKQKTPSSNKLLTEQDWTNVNNIHSLFLSSISNCEDDPESDSVSAETSEL